MRKKRLSHKTRLAECLRKLLEKERLTIKVAAGIACCPPSVLHGWLTGSYPAENIGGLKRLCDHFGVSLAVALTGEPDAATTALGFDALFEETDVFNGLARVRISRLTPRRGADMLPPTKGGQS